MRDEPRERLFRVRCYKREQPGAYVLVEILAPTREEAFEQCRDMGWTPDAEVWT